MVSHNFVTAVIINDTHYSFGPVFYAYYQHKGTWRESASITNLYLQELLHRTAANESN